MSEGAENPSDHYAVAVVKNATIIGHLPRKISRICSLFIRKGGVVTCTVVGSRRFSADLPQGGMEIPCILHFKPTKDNLYRNQHNF